MIRNFATFFAVLLMAATSHASTVYPDPTGDTFTGAGGGILDITSVEVSNDATDVSFTFNLAGDVVATDWGKYMVGISKNNGTGDTAGNGWGRPISMNPAGMNYWIGSWVDSGNGAELYTWGSGPGPWSLTEATYNAPPNNLISISKNTTSVTVKVPLAKVGLNPGDSFLFDAFTSGGGGGDSAVDALSSSVPSIADWGNPYNSPGNTGLSQYTVTAVPEPLSLALIGVGALTVGIGCKRRRR
jgi:hypothetical protein